MRRFARSAFLGLLLGALILGIGGRLVMRLTALIANQPGGFSLGGSVEVIATGAFFGLLAGLILPIFGKRLRRWHAPVLAACVFLLVALSSDAARGAASTVATPDRWLVLLLFYMLLLMFSFTLLALTR